MFGGGAERVVSIWANELTKRNYKVSIVLYARTDNEYKVAQGVHIYSIANSMKECDSLSVIQRILRFRKRIKEISPDVVISFLPIMQIYIMLSTLGLGIKRIETVRINPWRAEINSTKYRFLWRMCFVTSHAIIVQTPEQMEFFSDRLKKKTVVIPNPLDSRLASYHKTIYRSESHNAIAAGRLSLQKNYRMMIDAINIAREKYSDIKLFIYGDGPDRHNLEDYIKDNNLDSTIFLKGRSDNISEHMSKSDLFLMSSDYEGMPNSLIEAMAIGLPSISTDCKTGPKDIIKHKYNGFLVPTGDAVLMAEAIDEVFEMTSNEQKIMGDRAKANIEALCNTDLILDILCEVIGRY